LLQNRLETATRAPQLAHGSIKAAPQSRHCWLSAGFEVPHFRQSMETTGNALDWCTKTYTGNCRTSKPDVQRTTGRRARSDVRKSCVKSERRAILTEVQFNVGCGRLARALFEYCEDTMADDLAKLHPGTHDVSDQFSSTNIVKALSDYKAIKDGHGDYKFGDLTIKFFNLSGQEKQAWEDGVRLYPKDVQQEIKRHILHALNHKDGHGHENPITLSISWQDPLGQQFVSCTYDPNGPSYAILISGFPMPRHSRFATRRGKY
jgi:hypothetical protein